MKCPFLHRMAPKILGIVLTATCAFSALMILPEGASGAELKVAVADVNRLFNDYYKTREAADTIQDELANVRREINERMAKYKLLIDEFNILVKEANELSAELGRAKKAEAEEKRAEMQSMERQISQFQERRQRQIETEQATKRRDLFAQIFSVVGAKSKEKGFDLVFDLVRIRAQPDADPAPRQSGNDSRPDR